MFHDGIESNFIDFQTSFTPTMQEGRLAWNSDTGTLQLGMPGGSVNLEIGQEHIIRCRNVTGSTILNGSLVYVTGASGNKPLIALADADTAATADTIIGMATEDIANNSNGYVTERGIVRNLNTSTYAEGTQLYLSQTAGAFTSTAPTPPAHRVTIGIVTKQHATQGEILLFVHVGSDLASLHDVSLSGTANNDYLKYNSSLGYWQNATGSALTKVDDTNVTLTLGGSPTSALLAATSITVGWTGTLAATRGGTGKSSYTKGDILFANSTTTLTTDNTNFRWDSDFNYLYNDANIISDYAYSLTDQNVASAAATLSSPANSQNTVYSRVVGWEFTTTEYLYVTELGQYSSGFSGSRDVGIWDTATQTLQASATVSSAATDESGFKYQSITAVLLKPGTYRIGSVLPANEDVYSNFSSRSFYKVSFVKGVSAGTIVSPAPSLTYPLDDFAAGNSIAGPTLKVKSAIGVYISSNKIGIGTTSPSGFIHLVGEGTTDTRLYFDHFRTSSGSYPGLALRKARGNKLAQTTVVTGDTLGIVEYYGYDGSGYVPGAYVSAGASGSISTNVMPTRIAFGTNSGSSSALERVSISPAGYVGIATGTGVNASNLLTIGAVNTALGEAIRVNGNNTQNYMSFYNNTTRQGYIGTYSSGSGFIVSGDANGLYLYSAGTAVRVLSSAINVDGNATVGYINGSSGGVFITNTSTYGVASVQGVDSIFAPTTLGLNTNGGMVLVGTVTAVSSNVNLDVCKTLSYTDRAANPFKAQMALSSAAGGAGRLYIGTYYTVSVGVASSIQASDFFSAVDHGSNLLLNPLGGNIGINESVPELSLHITAAGGTLGTTATYSTNTKGILVKNSTNTANNGVGIWFDHGGLQAGIASSRANTGTWGTDIRFFVHPDTVANQYVMNEVMRINPSGYVGIRVTSPGATLDVGQTDGSTALRIQDGSGNIRMWINGLASGGFTLYDSPSAYAGITQVGGKVGIGASTPQSTLVICGNGNNAQGIEFGYSGSLSANFMESYNRNTSLSVDFAFYLAQSYAFKFYTNAVERMRITGTGFCQFLGSSTSTGIGSGGASSALFQNTSNTTNNWYELFFADSSGTTAGEIGFQFTNQTNHYGKLVLATRTPDGYGSRIEVYNGLIVGAPTGGDKGAGTINIAGDIYKNNTAYTNPDYVLEHFFNGKIEKFMNNKGAENYKGLLLIDQLKTYLKTHNRLPGISAEPIGVFERSDVILEKMEEAFLYIVGLHDRLTNLETRSG